MTTQERIDELWNRLGDIGNYEADNNEENARAAENLKAIETKLGAQEKVITAHQKQIADQQTEIAELKRTKFTEEQVEEMVQEAVEKTEKSFGGTFKRLLKSKDSQKAEIALQNKALELMAHEAPKYDCMKEIDECKDKDDCIQCLIDHFRAEAKKELKKGL